MKKLAILSLSLLGASMSTYAAQESEPKLAVGMAIDQQLSAVLSIEDTYRFTLGNRGAAADYLFKRGRFDDPQIPVTWYVGAGGWTHWDHDDYGVRAPVGLNWAANKHIDVYGEVQPEVDLHSGPDLQLGAAVGVTYRF